jgi:hypothetical protein
MFDSIAKVWSEVAEESSGSVNFSPSTRKPFKKATHYIHYDKPRGTLDRMRTSSHNSTRRGSPRILKPSTDQKKNTFWGTVGKILTGGGDQKDAELGNMKNYMTEMIRKRPREMSTTSIDERVHKDVLNLGPQPRTLSELQKRASNINARAERFTNGVSPEHKRVKRLQTGDLETSRSYNDSFSHLINKQTSLPQYSSTPKESKAKKNYTNRIIKINDLPSSPFAPIIQPTPTATTAEANRELSSHSHSPDDSIEKIKELNAKVDFLETTLQSLKEELRQTTERSMQLEQSFRLHSDNSMTQSPLGVPHRDPEPEVEEERPLSPVKLDLHTFKLIR